MIKPLLDRVLVKMIEKEEKTKSGIILNTNSNEKTQIAKVIQVGDIKENEKKYIHKNDKVIINRYGGMEIEYEGKEYLIIKQEDILAIIE